MSYLEDFKTKIGQIVFQNQLKSNKRKKEVCTADNAWNDGHPRDEDGFEQAGKYSLAKS